MYSTTQEKLDAVTAQLEKEVKKVIVFDKVVIPTNVHFQSKGYEREIEDLHGEFELDRLDYLDTIRKQDQQLKLLMQLMDKIQPIIKKDTNYSNLDRIKKEAIWNEDESRWILPELTMSRTILPIATNGNKWVKEKH